MIRKTFRPEIDGLRAFAVIPVILFHIYPNSITGGYLGVDVFFVISGYLISKILLKDIQNNSFSYKVFWTRRVRRIMPSLLATTILTLLITSLISYRPKLGDFGPEGLSAILSYANFHMWINNGDYWGISAEESPFLHTWSLSLEEQFYIILPAFLFLIHRYKVNSTKAIIFIAFLSLTLYVYCSESYPVANFYMLPTRAWELAIGCLVASLEIQGKLKYFANYKHRNLISHTGLGLILLAYALNDHPILSSATVYMVAIGAALIVAPDESSKNYPVLTNKPALFIGKVSYCAYLTHWPIIVILKEQYHLSEFTVKTAAIALISTCVATLAVHYAVEKPTRHSKKILLPVSSLAALAITLGLFDWKIASKISYSSDFETAIFPDEYDIIPTTENNTYWPNGRLSKAINPNKEIIVVGDSHGVMWAKTIDEISKSNNFTTRFYTITGENPFFNIYTDSEKTLSNRHVTKQQKIEYQRSLVSEIKKGVDLVIFISRWDARNEESISGLKSLIELSSKMGARTLVFHQPPRTPIGNVKTHQYLAYLGHPNAQEESVLLGLNKLNTPIIIQNEIIEGISLSYPQTDSFNVYDIFYRSDNKALVAYQNTPYYFDDDHLSYQGTQLAKNKLEEKIVEILARQPSESSTTKTTSKRRTTTKISTPLLRNAHLPSIH